jgi:hypothetical protein
MAAAAALAAIAAGRAAASSAQARAGVLGETSAAAAALGEMLWARGVAQADPGLCERISEYHRVGLASTIHSIHFCFECNLMADLNLVLKPYSTLSPNTVRSLLSSETPDRARVTKLCHVARDKALQRTSAGQVSDRGVVIADSSTPERADGARRRAAGFGPAGGAAEGGEG